MVFAELSAPDLQYFSSRVPRSECPHPPSEMWDLLLNPPTVKYFIFLVSVLQSTHGLQHESADWKIDPDLIKWECDGQSVKPWHWLPWPLAPSSGLRVQDNKKSLAAPLARARTMADLHFLCLELISVIWSSLIISSTFGRSHSRHQAPGKLDFNSS